MSSKKAYTMDENPFKTIQYGIITDPSDGQMYKTVKIGKQVWMAENLKWMGGVRYNLGNPSNCKILAPGDDIMNIEKYGCLYSKGLTGECFYECTWDNWKIPEVKDFQQLETYINSLDKDVVTALKSREDWSGKKSNGEDSLGFSAYPAGTLKGKGPYFISSDTSAFGKKAYFACGTSGGVCIIQGDKIEFKDKGNAVSVRLVMKDTKGWKPASVEELAMYEQKKVETRTILQKFKAWTSTYSVKHEAGTLSWTKDKAAQEMLKNQWVADVPKPQFGLFTDSRDGQMYKTVKIGDQVWFAENLRYDCSAVIKEPGHFAKKRGYLYGQKFVYGQEINDDIVKKVEQSVPKGWRLPKKGDYQKLKEYISIYSSKIENVWLDLWRSGAFGLQDQSINMLLEREKRDVNWTGRVCCLLEDPSSWVPASDAELVAYENYTQERLKPFKTAIDNEEEWDRVFDSTEEDRLLFLNKLAADVPKPEFSEYRDSRDGVLYKTVKIGGRIWFAENLRYNHKESFPCDGDPRLVKEYGRLYPYAALQDVIPEGWRLPNQEDVESLKNDLIKYGFIDTERACFALRSKNWYKGGDVLGLCILGSGSYYKGFRFFGEDAKFWCREGDVTCTFTVHFKGASFMEDNLFDGYSYSDNDREYFSIRLVKDE